ncbi:MAG: head-tail adaptor protein [Planctomycetia bacterium]|nr:head-tail adaptor protein [Planctomycetia bacterium]
MSSSLDLSNDFAVFDGAESVVIREPRPRSGEQTTAGLHRAVTLREIEASRGKYLAGDVRWHFPTSEVPACPVLGSTITDGEGRTWTILEANHETLGSRWRCTARAWEVAAELNDRVSILRASWTKTASGVPVANWIEVRRGLAARIQPAAQRRDDQAAPPTMRTTHRCFLADAIEFVADMRIRHDDALYEIRGVDDAERLDRGTILLLELVP